MRAYTLTELQLMLGFPVSLIFRWVTQPLLRSLPQCLLYCSGKDSSWEIKIHLPLGIFGLGHGQNDCGAFSAWLQGKRILRLFH